MRWHAFGCAGCIGSDLGLSRVVLGVAAVRLDARGWADLGRRFWVVLVLRAGGVGVMVSETRAFGGCLGAKRR